MGPLNASSSNPLSPGGSFRCGQDFTQPCRFLTSIQLKAGTRKDVAVILGHAREVALLHILVLLPGFIHVEPSCVDGRGAFQRGKRLDGFPGLLLGEA